MKDRYGPSWQIMPEGLTRLRSDPDRAAAGRAMNAMLQMRRNDMAGMERALAGE